MRLNKVVLILMVAGVALALAPGALLAGGSGCSKAKAAETAKADGEAGKPCCAKMANEAALVALKEAAEAKGCPKTAEAVAAAEVAMKKAATGSGCAKTDSATQEAALVAMQKAAAMAGCPKAKKAVAEAAEIAHAGETEGSAAEKVQ